MTPAHKYLDKQELDGIPCVQQTGFASTNEDILLALPDEDELLLTIQIFYKSTDWKK